VFQDAADRALLGIGVAAHREAERRACVGSGRAQPTRSGSAIVVRFPLPRAVSSEDEEGRS
jgi:hypothetical protein